VSVAPSEARRRAPALALLLALVVGLLALPLVPLWSAHRHYDETAAALADRLARLRARVATRGTLEALYAERTQGYGADTSFLASATDAVANAEIQAIIKRLVEQHGGTMLTSQALPSRQEEEFTRVGVRVRLRMPLESLVLVLHALDTGTPFLFLDGVAVTGQPALRRVQPGSTQLNIDLEVSGYLRPVPT
jgi:general secretion pathway protein M